MCSIFHCQCLIRRRLGENRDKEQELRNGTSFKQCVNQISEPISEGSDKIPRMVVSSVKDCVVTPFPEAHNTNIYAFLHLSDFVS